MRYLTVNFNWSSNASPESFESFTKHRFTGDAWLIMGNTSPTFPKNHIYCIDIMPRAKNSWPLKYQAVKLLGFAKDKLLFTSLWKTFEEKLPIVSGSADLVQLSGYYQYTPRIQSSMSFSKKFHADSLWQVIKLIVEGVGVAKQMHSHEFEMIYEVSEIELHRIFKQLRLLGYEVRNHNTNPQIPAGRYLIPYSFPTLTHRSVQLRKAI
jgi:DNA (cytosine-5)-methyltransferase 1